MTAVMGRGTELSDFPLPRQMAGPRFSLEQPQRGIQGSSEGRWGFGKGAAHRGGMPLVLFKALRAASPSRLREAGLQSQEGRGARPLRCSGEEESPGRRCPGSCTPRPPPGQHPRRGGRPGCFSSSFSKQSVVVKRAKQTQRNKSKQRRRRAAAPGRRRAVRREGFRKLLELLGPGLGKSLGCCFGFAPRGLPPCDHPCASPPSHLQKRGETLCPRGSVPNSATSWSPWLPWACSPYHPCPPASVGRAARQSAGTRSWESPQRFPRPSKPVPPRSCSGAQAGLCSTVFSNGNV